MEEAFNYYHSISIVEFFSWSSNIKAEVFHCHSWLGAWTHVCVSVCVCILGFKVKFYNLDKFYGKREMFLKPKKRSFMTGTVQNLAGLDSLCALGSHQAQLRHPLQVIRWKSNFKAHYFFFFVSPGLSDFLSLRCCVWQKVRLLAGKSARCRTWSSSHILPWYCSSALFYRTALDN